MTYPNMPYGQPGMPQAYPQAANGYPNPQIPFDPNLADYYINLLNRMLQERNQPAELRTFMGHLLNWRTNSQSTVSNVMRLVNETRQRLMSIGVDLNQTVPEGFVRQALDAYLADRMPKVQAEYQRQMYTMQQQQQQRNMGAPIPGYHSYPNQQPGMPQYPQAGNYTQPPVMMNPNDPQGVMGGMSGFGGGGGQYAPTIDYDPLPPVTNTQSYTAPQPAAPQTQPYPQNQPVSQQPVPDFTAGTAAVFNAGGNVYDAPNGGVSPQPAQPAAVPTGPKAVDLNLQFTRDEVPHDLACYIDDDLVSISKVSSTPVLHTHAQASVVTVKHACNTMDDAIEALQEGLPSELVDNEFLHIINFNQLHSLNIPTEAFLSIREAVLEKYETGGKDWRALLHVMDDTKTRYSKVLGEFLVEHINRFMCRYYRTEDSLGSILTLSSLWDVNDLIEGKFGGALKDQHDWRGRLDKLMHQVIHELFQELEVVDADSEHKSDLIRCDQIDLVVDGVTKYDLAFVDEEKKAAWINAFVANNTLLRFRRTVAITNMVNEGALRGDDMHQCATSNESQQLFFASYNELNKVHGNQHLECVYFVRGNSLDLSEKNLIDGKMMIYPYLRTPEGGAPENFNRRRPHAVSLKMCYGK